MTIGHGFQYRWGACSRRADRRPAGRRTEPTPRKCPIRADAGSPVETRATGSNSGWLGTRGNTRIRGVVGLMVCGCGSWVVAVDGREAGATTTLDPTTGVTAPRSRP